MTEEELRATVRRLMLDNEKHGYSGLLGQSYCYVAPALKPYPFQWFWDTCFHVVILARLGECDVAKRSFRSLFAMQEEDGAWPYEGVYRVASGGKRRGQGFQHQKSPIGRRRTVRDRGRPLR